MNLGDTLKRTGIAAGVTAGVGGVVYAGQRLLATRLRHRDDPDADYPLVPAFDEAIRIDSHDGGTLYIISRGEGPPIVFCHGVTLSSRVWAKQFDSIPGRRVPRPRVRRARPRRVHRRRHRPLARQPRRRRAQRARGPRPPRTRCSSVIRWAAWPMQAFAIRHPDVAPARVSGLVLLSTPSHTVTSDARRTPRVALERVTGVVPDVGTFMRQQQPRPPARPHRLR